jgi:4-amino-4-deoxy-L-arabinose transferase-like glycosyltransferase
MANRLHQSLIAERLRKSWPVLLFLLALIPRLPGLRLFLTTDEPFFAHEAANVINAFLRGQFPETYWHFYPGVTLIWLDGLGLAVGWAVARLVGATTQPFGLYIGQDILDLIVAIRLPYALLTSLFVVAVYSLTRRLFDQRIALLGALFVALDPFFLAHSRVAHGDAAVTIFMAVSALALFVHLRTWEPPTRRGYRWLVLSAVSGGLAALTKAPGQFMAVFVVLVAVLDWLVRSRQASRPDWRLGGQWLARLALWAAVAAVVFVALWPAMWADPAGTIARMLGETLGKVEAGHLVFFMGQPTLNPGLWFYPTVIASRLTPITLMGTVLSLMVLVAGLVKQRRNPDASVGRWDNYRTAALLWLFVLTLLLFGSLSPKKQDRYLLPLFPFLDLLAAFAFVRIGEWASGRVGESASQRISEWAKGRVSEWANGRMGEWANGRRGEGASGRERDRGGREHRSPITHYASRVTHQALLITLLLVILVAAHAYPVVAAYPYYLAYFNPLLGGLPRAVETTLVGWGEGMEQAAAYLNGQPNAESLYVAAVPSQTLLPYFRGTGQNFYTNDVALRADKVVLYISQVQRLAPSPEIVRYFQSREPEHVVTVRGQPYAWVYPGPKFITAELPAGAIPANNGFGGQLRLAGYETSPKDAAVEVTLYWHGLEPMSVDYTISVRLLAADGGRLAQHDGWPVDGLLPTSQWRPGDYVRDIHTLAVPAGAEVGLVHVVVYDAASGLPLGPPVDLLAPW